MKNKTTIEAIIHNTPYKTTIQAGNHTLTSDEPIENGGKDKGFNPFELLLSSLGSCMAITMKMYAERKDWDIGEVKVELAMEKEGEYTVINRKVTFSDDLTAEQQKRLKQIANACPIHKILTTKTVISSLKEV